MENFNLMKVNIEKVVNSLLSNITSIIPITITNNDKIYKDFNHTTLLNNHNNISIISENNKIINDKNFTFNSIINGKNNTNESKENLFLNQSYIKNINFSTNINYLNSHVINNNLYNNLTNISNLNNTTHNLNNIMINSTQPNLLNVHHNLRNEKSNKTDHSSSHVIKTPQISIKKNINEKHIKNPLVHMHDNKHDVINESSDTNYVLILGIILPIILIIIFLIYCFIKKKKKINENNNDPNKIRINNSGAKKVSYRDVQNTSSLNILDPNNTSMNQIKILNLKNNFNILNNKSSETSGKRKRDRNQNENNKSTDIEKEGDKGVQKEIKEEIKQYVIEEQNNN